jgi:hypothetical protein
MMVNRRAKIDGKTARQHAQAINAMGVHWDDFARARRTMTYGRYFPPSWCRRESQYQGQFYRHRAYLTKVGKLLKEMQCG